MTDEDALEEQFFEALGLGPSPSNRSKFRKKTHSEKLEFYKRKYKRLPPQERQRLLSKGYARDKVHSSIVAANVRREDKGLSTYGANRHIFVRKATRDKIGFKTFHDQFKREVSEKPLQAQIGDQARSEVWKGRDYVVLRDARGRFKGHKRK